MRKILAMVLVLGLLLVIGPTTAKANDIVENLVFNGTATCVSSACAAFGFSSGPLTGSYQFDVTTQMIVGPWSFSSPLGMLSSTDVGANATVSTLGVPGDTGDTFGIATASFGEFFTLYFPGAGQVRSKLARSTALRMGARQKQEEVLAIQASMQLPAPLP